MKNIHRLFFILLAISAGVSSCKKDARTRWDAEMLVPIATTSLSLQNIVKDTGVIKTNPDNSLALSINKLLYQFSIADQVVDIPDTSIGQKFTLDSLRLANIYIDYNLSLGAIATNMLQSPDASVQFFGQFLIAQNGNSSIIPPISGFNSDVFAFDGSQFFQTATLVQGSFRMWVRNYFPVDVTNVILELRNATSNTLIMADTIPYIGARDSLYQVIDISGRTIEGSMSVKLINLDSPGSNGVPVPIDTSDHVNLSVEIANLRVSEAIAIFPAQDILRTTEEVTQDIGERKLTYVDARSGQLRVQISSSVQQPLYLAYILEGAFDKYGNPLITYTNIRAASVFEPVVTIDSTLNISGYAINLTGKDGTKFNTYTQTIIAHADSTGQLAHITLADSLNIRYTIQNVAPNYVKGYIGKDTITAIDSADFAFLDIFKSGSVDLEKVDMNFSVENGIGVDGQVKINALTALSTRNGSRALTGSIIGQPLIIDRAMEFPSPPNSGNLLPSYKNFAINSSNSNIKDLLGILPNKLQYDVEVKTNLQGNTQQYRDFAYLESYMKINMNAEVPLSLIANHLVLQDTFDFDLSATNTNVAGISDGILNLIAHNKYPIDATITMVAYDENWIAVDTIVSNTVVVGGDLDNSCRVQTAKKNKIPVYVNEVRMENIKRAKHAVVIADFATVSNNAACNNQHLKIYSDYTLDITFTARFNYKVNMKL